MTTRQPTPGVHENFAEQQASFPPANLLQVRPGDRFVVRSDRPLSKEMVHHLTENWRQFAGDEVKLLILDKGFDLSVLRDEETPPPHSHLVGTIDCPCTTFEQDEDCPVGYPSLLCTACDGKGIAPVDKVVALAAEMMKVAEQVGELEDPFAAWETIDLIKSQYGQLRKALVAADQFITNGIELGFIRMPDPEGGDTALLTPGIVREALATTEGRPDE